MPRDGRGHGPARAPAPVCPSCRGPLVFAAAGDIVCRRCDVSHPRVNGIPVLVPEPATQVRRWWGQLERFNRACEREVEHAREQATRPGLLPETRVRLCTLIDAERANAGQVNALLHGPLVQAARDVRASLETKEELPSLLAYFELALRDWGWPDNDENARALALIRDTVSTDDLGHVLVLGGGACRLADDLHRTLRPQSTTVLDLDVLLLSIAGKVLAGETLSFRDAPWDANQLAELGITRVLRRAPSIAGAEPALGPRLLFADGLVPPFADQTFDTVLTPWFVDQAPDDVRDLVGEIARVLVRGGRWINYGPLIYQARTQLADALTREELEAMVGCAGFSIVRHGQGRWPYLCSPLKARGRLELSFCFEALLDHEPRTTAEGLPPWIVLPHLPVPAIPGGPREAYRRPIVSRIAELVDGRRSINLIAGVLGAAFGTDPASLRDGIRASLHECHPDLKAAAATDGARLPGRPHRD